MLYVYVESNHTDLCLELVKCSRYWLDWNFEMTWRHHYDTRQAPCFKCTYVEKGSKLNQIDASRSYCTFCLSKCFLFVEVGQDRELHIPSGGILIGTNINFIAFYHNISTAF